MVGKSSSMFVGLTVRNILLIDKLDLQFGEGLCVLTGETGAGKSIILEALGLATGARGDSALVREGEANGVVTAEFDVPADHPARALVGDQGLDGSGNLLLRRSVGADGRSRAFVNDQPVSVGLLRVLGDGLIEYHGQNDDRGLLNPAGHRALLERFGVLGPQADEVRSGFTALRDCEQVRYSAEQELETARADEAYLRHVLDELDELDPREGEEEQLANERSLLMHGTKLAEEFSGVLANMTESGGVDALMRSGLRRLERVLDRVDNGRGQFADLLAVLERASIEATEAVAALEEATQGIQHDPARLEHTDERLSALRAAARKHQCTIDQLSGLKDRLTKRLQAIDGSADHIAALADAENKAREKFAAAVSRLGKARAEAAERLDEAINRELVQLKLEKAAFHTSVDPLPPDKWTAAGGERIEFQVSTNPGAPLGALARIASGGELSRFLLAIKVVLAAEGEPATLVFDEIDRGIGGAVAGAVGERLARLAERTQVLVVTHSPQVAAQARHHWRIDKAPQPETSEGGKENALERLVTRVIRLDDDARREEIARMLSGVRVTDEARAAADRLLDADAA
jgi:DNA repair protein RecN (Recombination protein N)